MRHFKSLRWAPLGLALALTVPLSSTSTSVARGQDMAGQDGMKNETASSLLAKGIETEKGSLEEACTVYLRLLEKFPKDELSPRARLRLGLCLAKLDHVEEARARLREARATGKDDPALCHDAEQALMALPPEKPDAPKPDAPATKPEAPSKPAPAPKPESAPVGSTVPAPKPAVKPAPATPPAPPADDERSKLVAKIEALDKQKKDTIEEVHRLEDAGRTEEAYALRAKADKLLNEIDAVKQQLRALAQRPRKPAPAPAPSTPKTPVPDTLDEAGKQRLLLALKRDKLEASAKAADQRAQDLKNAGKLDEAKAAQAEATKARADAAEVSEQLKKLGPGPTANASPAAADPATQQENELKAALEKARAALKEIDGKADGPAKEAARADVKAKEKVLHDFQAAREAAGEKTRLDRLAEQMRKRGAPQWELDARLALAQKEIDVEHSYREKIRPLRKLLNEEGKNAAAGAADSQNAKDEKAQIVALEKQKRDEIDKLRADTEGSILARAKSELEAALKQKADELKAQGLPQAEIDMRIAEMRRDLESKLPGRNPEKPSEKKNADGASKEPSKEAAREHALVEENLRLRRRVEELERELAALKGQLVKGSADAGTAPPGGPIPAQTTVPPPH